MLKASGFNKNLISTPLPHIDFTMWRITTIWFFFIILTSLVGGRLIQLHIAHTHFLKAQGNARTLRKVDIPSYRGMLTDRRGIPLAISTPVHAIWINPRHFMPEPAQYQKLAKLLGISKQQLLQKVEKNAHRGFLYLKRGVPPDTADKIKALKISGLSLKREFRRYYPAGNQTAQLVGFTNIDDIGQAGLESAFESSLKPTVGKKRVLEDRTGHWVQDVDHLQTARSGEDIALSIDLRLQGLAYRELEKALKLYKAKSATLVMLDIRSGEILAMVSAPSFNPNNRNERFGSATHNRALLDQIEPGSTIKPFSIASALESRQFTPQTLINTSPGYYPLGRHTVRDIHNYGTLTIKEVLSKSSNIGITKVTLALPPEQLLSTFQKLGLGTDINTHFPGERRGKLPNVPKNPFVHATLAFGYGLAVTPLQIAHAYATLASGGIKRPISLTRTTFANKLLEERVLSEDVARETLMMLTGVLSGGGTGKRANIQGFKTAGKTGTTRVVGPQGYDAKRHIALFAGVTPVDSPRLATVIVVEEPSEEGYNQYYGGFVAAPIYKNVVSKALLILNIPPDNTES